MTIVGTGSGMEQEEAPVAAGRARRPRGWPAASLMTALRGSPAGAGFGWAAGGPGCPRFGNWTPRPPTSAAGDDLFPGSCGVLWPASLRCCRAPPADLSQTALPL